MYTVTITLEATAEIGTGGEEYQAVVDCLNEAQDLLNDALFSGLTVIELDGKERKCLPTQAKKFSICKCSGENLAWSEDFHRV